MKESFRDKGRESGDRFYEEKIAKKVMQLLNVEGRLRSFANREAGMKRTRKKDNLYERKQYMKKVRNTKKFFQGTSLILFQE